MSRPLVGIICCNKLFGAFDSPNHAASDTYVRATDEAVGGIAILIPANGDAADCETLIERIDGLILTGSRSMVAPGLYGGAALADGTPEDPRRDAVTMRLVPLALARSVPVLAICRGMQELNVALGGSLHQRLADDPAGLDHATLRVADYDVRTGKRHDVALVEGGLLRRIARGADRIAVNSLHDQGVARLGTGLAVEARASDGLVEAVRADPGGGFVLGVQWHPEYDHRTDDVSRGIFTAFGEAMRK